ncbi:hypothetical protein CTAYLR_009987 [Chrysophaeum taylorii]|uniref:Uncharacterized protein n=1 Tax=Chrysophaeum taylorii TaxID=2483200 RepID=A0AAD7UJX2_9STRA|nr:hypothetical protein CTAYLR_009987 [Chrysophaeum taylorii]
MSRTDGEALARAHEFVRDDERDRECWSSWETRMAARYYRRLHKEYAIVDLSRWQEGACGLRWRTEREVRAGVGERSCAAKQCDSAEGLRSFELPFSYEEHGDHKCELVKVRACRSCASKLATLGATKRSRKKRRHPL